MALGGLKEHPYKLQYHVICASVCSIVQTSNYPRPFHYQSRLTTFLDLSYIINGSRLAAFMLIIEQVMVHWVRTPSPMTQILFTGSGGISPVRVRKHPFSLFPWILFLCCATISASWPFGNLPDKDTSLTALCILCSILILLVMLLLSVLN